MKNVLLFLLLTVIVFFFLHTTLYAQIAVADTGVIYATLGNNDPNAGSLIKIDMATGAGTMIGPTGIVGAGGPGVPCLAIKTTGEMYATNIDGYCNLYQIDAVTGAATLIGNTGLLATDAMAFDGNNTLYTVDSYDSLFTVDETTGAATFVVVLSRDIRGIEFDPTTGLLWGGATGDDGIYMLNRTTGEATLIGNTGLGGATPGICFDSLGNLFASKGGGGSPNNLVSINKATGEGTVIGPIGYTAVAGMSIRVVNKIVGVEELSSGIPESFELMQNFPNPFNPGTKIQFSLPQPSFVTLEIFNALGERVGVLVSDELNTGTYNYDWNASNLTSGIYFYSLNAGTFTQTKKMILLK